VILGRPSGYDERAGPQGPALFLAPRHPNIPDRKRERHMALEADLLIDRRRLKRGLALWRALAVLLLLAGGLAVAARTTNLPIPGGGQVARLTVQGFIGDDRKLFEALEALGRDSRTRALIVAIDSPGGSVGGGEALFAALERLRAQKPVVAVMRGTAASAGYMIALGTDRIYARESTVTGSIGVLLQAIDASELLGRLGVRGGGIASRPLNDGGLRGYLQEAAIWLDWVQTWLPSVRVPEIEPFGATVRA